MALQEAIEIPNEPLQKKEVHLRPRTLVLGLGTVLIIATILLIIVEGRRPVDVDGSQGTWGGTGGVEFWGGRTRATERARPSVQELLAQDGPEVSHYVPLQRNTAPGDATEEDTDLATLFNSLLSPKKPRNTSSEAPAFNAYDFIPRGLVSVETRTTELTPLQQELYLYGNDIGGYLRTFEDSHPNMVTTLTNAREDLGNPTKAAAAAQIGIDYRALGRELQGMSTVPSSAGTLHAAFADIHEQLGSSLEAVARARNNTAFLDAVDIYNTQVEAYARSFVGLASLFSAAGVIFKKEDPGSVFTFSATPSL